MIKEEKKGRATYLDLRCGGSLITYSHIITAAHCLIDRKTRKKLIKYDDLKVIIGSNDPIETCEGVERKILDYSFHPEYLYEEAYFDISVATLDKKVLKSEVPSLNPICLPTQPNQEYGQYL